MTSLRTPDEKVVAWARHCEQFGYPPEAARIMAEQEHQRGRALEALHEIASGFPRVDPIKRGAKARHVALAAIREIEGTQP